MATIAFEFRRVLDAFVELTGSSPDFAAWQCHDFSMRGMSGVHDASLFGGDMTAKGYRTLNQRVGLIYGDSITLERQYEILSRLAKKGFSAGNVVFGIGSFTYQLITRDTFGMAMKATYAVVDKVGRELFKDPKTDAGGVKKSSKGLLRVERQGNDFVLYDQQAVEHEFQGALEPVFLNGRLCRDMTLAQIRANLKASKVVDALPELQ